jgi:hypothetical protein
MWSRILTPGCMSVAEMLLKVLICGSKLGVDPGRDMCCTLTARGKKLLQDVTWIELGTYRIVRYPMTAKAANAKTAMIIPIRDIRLSLEDCSSISPGRWGRLRGSAQGRKRYRHSGTSQSQRLPA